MAAWRTTDVHKTRAAACLLACLLALGCLCAPAAGARLPGRRALLAGVAASCTQSPQELLTNGFFNPRDLPSMNNLLMMATLSNDAYPWAKMYDFHMADVVGGLDHNQTLHFFDTFRAKYAPLGARSINFVTFYAADGLSAGHAIVIGLPSDVLIVFRGTSDLSQVFATGRYDKQQWTIMNTTMQMYYAPWASMQGLWPKLLPVVRAAVAATDDPAAAKLYTTGHSLGGASSFLGALLLAEQGYTIGGVWGFEPYKVGTTCAPHEDCWVSVYDRLLGDVSYMIWNNQDPIPLLVDAYYQTSFNASEFGHVPRDRNLLRIAGDKCHFVDGAGAELAQECPAEVDAADGAADGVCRNNFDDHMPWVVQKRIAHCALIAGPHAGPVSTSAMRVDGCTRNSVWGGLLGLEAPELTGR